MKKLFDPISLSGHHFLLASHLPTGNAWKKSFDFNDPFGKLFYSLGVEFRRFQVLEQTFYNEMNPDKAVELLENWETSLGIPNTCFNNQIATIKDRQIQVNQVFSKFGGVQTNADFVRVAMAFGISIVTESGESEGSIVDDTERAHTLFHTIQYSVLPNDFFPIPFPIPFRTSSSEFLPCLFDMIAPATVQNIFTDESSSTTVFITEDEDEFISEDGLNFFIPE
jgi:uncharacterized protein YmfQ (DUF2313 family)